MGKTAEVLARDFLLPNEFCFGAIKFFGVQALCSKQVGFFQ